MNQIVLRTFQHGDESAFRRLNEDWISRHFALEAEDHLILSDPETHILQPGGEICIAELDGEVIGCCALIRIAPGELELAKMTVSEAARGRDVGRKLLEFAVAQCRRMGAHSLCLESNTKAAAAVHLYEEMGFRHLQAPRHPSKFERANVFMELPLGSAPKSSECAE